MLFKMERFDPNAIPIPMDGPSRLLPEISPIPSMSIAAAEAYKVGDRTIVTELPLMLTVRLGGFELALLRMPSASKS
jgi:hypothetical protein